METTTHFIECLRALCANPSHGGVEGVADAIGASAENLKQILAGTKLPSGNPRGVGPKLRRNLDATFPGWADRTPCDVSNPHWLDMLAAALAAVPKDRRAEVGKLLDTWATSGGSPDYRQMLEKILTGARPGNHKAA